MAPAQGAAPGDPSGCQHRAGDACLRSFALPNGAGRMRYYASQEPESLHGARPRSALVVMHGHPRDANRSFEAGLRAAEGARRLQDTVVIAPLYQVPGDQAVHCRSHGVPAAESEDAVWTCGGWLAGEPSLGPHPIGAFAALDALVAELVHRWPGLRSVTLAGFSAGAQMLQHSVAFAADPPDSVSLRYVIADPGTWLYFDPVRPQPRIAGQNTDWAACGTGAAFPGACGFVFQVPPAASTCPGHDRWKYGLQALPGHLGRDAATARSRYAAAQIDYLEAALDSSADKGAFYPILDKSCAAMLQGPFRLQRGQAFAAYEREMLTPQWPRRFVVVPGCAHDVACVLPSEAARPLLFPPGP
ncbi:Uncharacterised protein [Delftia tsuruhatensis]|nr:Uncharacterised protein [Delftia tsuruhatensis]CAC9682910.1 Uncharacterised protein [Delftia tsuruhatensis]